MASVKHSPDRFLPLPFRRGEKDVPDWSLCLKHISINHSSNNTSAVGEALQRMTQMHHSIVKSCCTDSKVPPNENFIDLTLKPYIQLVVMAQAHLPLHSGLCHKNMRFFARDSFDDSIKYESLNGNLELVSNLYNLAASYAYVGASDSQSGTVDGAKSGFKCFQNAAGYYQMVEQLLERLPPEHIVKGDLKADSLQLLQRLCLVQAHHCGYLKAENDMKGKHAVLSKIAWEAGKQYDDVMSLLKASAWYASKKGSVLGYETHLACCAKIFYARGSLHLAEERMAAGEAGEAIARYQQALAYLSGVPKMPSPESRSWVSSIIDAVNTEHKKAVSANESVYFMRVPKEVPAPEGLPRPLGKLPDNLPNFTQFESKRGEDPFFGIVPAHIAQAAAAWREKQRNLVSVCTKAASANRKTTQEKLQKMGVLAVIEVLSGESRNQGRVPEQLRNKIMALRSRDDGSSGSVTEALMNKVGFATQLSLAAEEKIQSISKELEMEKKEDCAYLEAYGEFMWRAVRRPSGELPDVHAINAAIVDHRNGIQQWLLGPLAKTKQVMEESLRDLGRLDWPMEDLDALMPYVETKEAREQTQAVMDQVGRLKSLVANKDQLEARQRDAQKALQGLLESDSITFSLSAVEPSQRDAVLQSASREIADSIEKLNALVREEGTLLGGIEETTASLGILQSADPTTAKIQAVCNGIENAIAIFQSLNQELMDIINYGTKISDAIEGTLSTAQSFALSRKLEAEELKVSLDYQIAAKIQEIERNKPSNQALEASRQRQEDLKRQIEELERQQRMNEPERESRMADLLRRQKEVTAHFSQMNTVPGAPVNSPPPYMYSAPSTQVPAGGGQVRGQEPPPPSYEAVFGGAGSPAQPPKTHPVHPPPPQSNAYGYPPQSHPQLQQPHPYPTMQPQWQQPPQQTPYTGNVYPGPPPL